VNPLDPLALGALRGQAPRIHTFALSQLVQVLRGACPARVLEEARQASNTRRPQTSSQGKGTSPRSMALEAVLARFPEDYRTLLRPRLELHFPQALVRGQLDGLLVGRGEAVGLKWVGRTSPKRDALEALEFCLHNFAQRNGLRPRLLLIRPHRVLSYSLAPVGSPAYRRTAEALQRAVVVLRRGVRVGGRWCRGCPLRHGCPARAL